MRCGLFATRHNRREPVFEVVGDAEKVRHPDPATDHREYRQHDQRHRHGFRRLVQVTAGVGIHPFFAVESEVNQPEHIERRKTGRHKTDDPEYRVAVH